MRAGIRARDREPEAGSTLVGARLRAAAEAVEEKWSELVADASAAILDGDADVPVALFGGDRDRRRAVGEGVQDQIPDHPFDRDGVDIGLEVGRDFDLDT